MSGVVSKKLKFKGDKPKKKKRSHRDEGGEGGGADELAALAAADPRGRSHPPLFTPIITLLLRFILGSHSCQSEFLDRSSLENSADLLG